MVSSRGCDIIAKKNFPGFLQGTRVPKTSQYGGFYDPPKRYKAGKARRHAKKAKRENARLSGSFSLNRHSGDDRAFARKQLRYHNIQESRQSGNLLSRFP